MSDEKPWASEPTPLCDEDVHADVAQGGLVVETVPIETARDLERRLRHALKLVEKLRADSECGDFDEDDLEQRLTRIEETLTT